MSQESNNTLHQCLHAVWQRTQRRHAAGAALAFARWFIPLALLTLFGLSKPDTRLISVLVLLPMAAMTVVFLGNGVHPGYSYGPRYWVPLLPLIAIAGVAGLKAMAPRPARLALIGVVGAGVFSALSALPDLLLSDGSSLFNRPPFIERVGR